MSVLSRLIGGSAASQGRRSADRSRRSYERRSNGRDHYDGGGGGGGNRWRDGADDLPPSEYDLLTEEERVEEARKINEGERRGGGRRMKEGERREEGGVAKMRKEEGGRVDRGGKNILPSPCLSVC